MSITRNILILSVLLLGGFFLKANDSLNYSILNGFTENKGQVIDMDGKQCPDVLFTYDTDNARLFFYKDKITYAFYRFEHEETSESIEKKNNGDLQAAEMLSLRIRQQRIDLEFQNSNNETQISFDKPLDHKVNFYYGHLPMGITNQAVYAEVKYEDMYPNIDFIFKAMPSGLKYDIILKPGANINDIKLQYLGAKPLKLENGALIIENEICTYKEIIPASFKLANNEPISVNYNLLNDKSFGFSSKDITTIAQETIVIDPSLNWSTYIENSSTGYVSTIRGNNTVDDEGNFFYQINSYTANLPVASPGASSYYDPSYNPSSGLDIYFAKFNSNRSLVWATYLGGSEGNQSNYYDHGMDTHNGYLYLCGNTTSNNFPVTNQGGGAYYVGTQPGNTCGFLSKFSIATGAMIHSTYLESYNNHCLDVAPNGNIAVISFNYDWSVTPNVMARSGAYNQASHGGDSDIFIYMFNSSMAQIWGTYFGGAGYTDAMGLVFDSNNNLFMFSRSSSTSAMIFANPGGGAYYDNSFQSKYDLGISKFNTSGSLVWSTLYGGSGLEGLSYSNIDVNDDDDVIITSTTRSTDINTQDQGGAAYYDGTAPTGLTNGWGGDPGSGFYARFNNSGVLQHATYIGVNNESIYLHDHAQGPCNKQYILLHAKAFPTTSLAGSYNVTNSDPTTNNYMVIEFEDDFSINWASYLQSNNCMFERLAINNNLGRLYATGASKSSSATTLNPGGGAYYDGTYNSGTNYAKLVMEFDIGGSGLPVSVSISATTSTVCYGSSISSTFTASPTNGGSSPSYQWYLNGSPVGSNSSSYFNSSLSSGDFVTCVLTSSESCVSNNPATSNTITISAYNSGTATGTWVGSYSTNWFDCRNWGNGRIPDATINATIPSGCSYYPVITSGSANCRYMYIQSGGYLTVNGGTLTVNGYFYKYSGGYATYTSGTCNVFYRYDNYGPSGNSTVNGGTLNIGTAATSSSYYIRNLNGNLNISSGYLDAGYYLYNYNGYPSNNVNITGGSVYADNIPNYEGAIYQSGGTLTTNGYYREYDTGGGNYYGSGSGVINFNGTSNTYIRLMRTGTYFNHVNINGAYYIETGSLQNLDVNGNFTIASGKSFDSNARTMYIAGHWTNSGTFTHDNNTVHIDGSTNSQIKGTSITTFYNLNLNSTSASYNALENGTGNSAGIRINVSHDLTLTDGSFELNTNSSGGIELDVNGQINIGTNGVFNVNDGSCEVYCAGNWTNSGSFDSGSNTVYFDGTGTLNSGGTTTTKDFYNLNCTNGTRTISTNHVQINNNFIISGGNWTPSNVYTYVNGNVSKTNGILTMDSSSDRIYHTGSTFTINGGTVSLTSACQIHTSGNVAISNDNTFVSGDVRFYMEGSTNTTISMTGANNRIYNYFYNAKSNGIKVTALSDVRIYHFIHDNGIFDVNGNNISNYGVYYGYDYGELRMASGNFRVGSNGYNGGTYSPFYCAANWSESISGGTIEVYGGSHGTYGNVCFNSGSNFTPTGGTFKLTGTNSKTIQIREATNFNFNHLDLGNGSNTITVSLWAAGYTCDINGNLNINSNTTFNSVSEPIEIAGHWTNNYSFIRGTGTVTFDGSAAQNITGSSMTTFYNLAINKTSNNVTLQNDAITTNNLNLLSGLLNTSNTNLLTMNDNSTSSNASDASFVNGPMKKIGNDAFEFPVGKNTSGNIWAPIAISAPSLTTDAFTIEYFFTDPGHYFWNQAYMTNLHHVSSIEYWEVDRTSGSSSPALTLHWKNAQRSDIHSLADTKVAHWNTSTNKWENQGGIASGAVSPSTGNGSITSDMTFPNYSPVTFGSLTASNPLPIDLINFDAICKGNYIELIWTTSAEINNNYFTIEKSTDGLHYEAIASIPGAGFSNENIDYVEYDYNTISENIYYRLRQTDFNGEQTVSLPIVANCDESTTEFNIDIFNNKNNSFTLQVNGCNDNLIYYITDQLGRKLQAINQHSYDNSYFFSLSNYSSAIYNVVVICGDKINSKKIFNK